jgi:hypothetical protein
VPVGSSFFYLGTAATKEFNHFIIIISAQNEKMIASAKNANGNTYSWSL